MRFWAPSPRGPAKPDLWPRDAIVEAPLPLTTQRWQCTLHTKQRHLDAALETETHQKPWQWKVKKTKEKNNICKWGKNSASCFQGLKYTLVRLQGLTSRWQQAPDLPTREGSRGGSVGTGKAALQGARMAAELLVIPGQWVFAQQSARLFLPASPHPPPHPPSSLSRNRTSCNANARRTRDNEQFGSDNASRSVCGELLTGGRADAAGRRGRRGRRRREAGETRCSVSLFSVTFFWGGNYSSHGRKMSAEGFSPPPPPPPPLAFSA